MVRFAEASKIAIRVGAPDAARRLDLAPDVEAQVFRIVQEALTNVRKHAGARRAEVVFSLDDGRLDVVIADDGHGIVASPGAADRPHYGLARDARAGRQHRRDGRLVEPARAAAAGSTSRSRRRPRAGRRPGRATA